MKFRWVVTDYKNEWFVDDVKVKDFNEFANKLGAYASVDLQGEGKKIQQDKSKGSNSWMTLLIACAKLANKEMLTQEILDKMTKAKGQNAPERLTYIVEICGGVTQAEEICGKSLEDLTALGDLIKVFSTATRSIAKKENENFSELLKDCIQTYLGCDGPKQIKLVDFIYKMGDFLEIDIFKWVAKNEVETIDQITKFASTVKNSCQYAERNNEIRSILECLVQKNPQEIPSQYLDEYCKIFKVARSILQVSSNAEQSGESPKVSI